MSSDKKPTRKSTTGPADGQRRVAKTPKRRTFVASDQQRSRAIDLLLTDPDPVVRRAALLAVERVMGADLALWSHATLQKHVLWSIKFAAEQMGGARTPDTEKWWAERATKEIGKTLRDPRGCGMGKPEGLTDDLVHAAIVGWAERPGRRSSGSRPDNARRKEKTALALLRAVGLASNISLEAVTKLIDRHVGRGVDPVIRVG